MKINYEKVFNMFCSGSTLKQELREPFKQEHIYASTDTHSMIYMPTSVADLPFEEQYNTYVGRVIPLILHEEIALDVSKLHSSIEESTPMIDDWKTIYSTCLECGGDGELECYLGHPHECTKCKGSGEISEKILSELKVPDTRTIFKFNGMGADDVGLHYKQLTRLVSAAKELGENTIYKVYGSKRTPYVFKVGKTNIMVMPALTLNESMPIILPFDFHFQPK